jgi:hypothetical protein
MKATAQIFTRLYIQSKVRALLLADYMAEYGIEVDEVIISSSGNCTVVVMGDNEQITKLLNQFNEDYGDY